MKYIRVQWKHSNPAYPVLLYSELDDLRWESRKVEIFSDGRCGYANEGESEFGTRLSIEPIPPLDEIAADPEFAPSEITKDEFEIVWANRKGSQAK